MSMKNFTIPENLATAILNYLANQKYAEVFQLVQALQNLKPLEEPKNEKAPVNPDTDNAC